MTLDTLAQGPFTPAQVHIHWDPAPAPTTPESAAHIDARWQIYLDEARAQSRDLFNAPLAACAAVRLADGILAVDLRPTDYKTFLVTCLRDRPWFLQHAPQSIAAAPGNSALVTCGPHAFLGLRSPRVATYPRRAHVFGGVLDVDPASPPTSVDHLLAHLLRELREELRLAPTALAAPPTLLGLFRDPLLHQPEFLWHCELTAPPTTLTPHEHEALLVLSRTPDADESRLTPIAAAALERWRAR